MKHLDEERIEALRHWGEGLARDARDEMRAAGRAILLLIEEVEHLRDEHPVETPAAVLDEHEDEQDVPASLRSRLKQFGRRQPEITST